MIKNNQLLDNGHIEVQLPLEELYPLIENCDWQNLDQRLLELFKPSGELFKFYKNYVEFDSIEHIIAIRDGSDPDEEDGIWHDDGSRIAAFSISLTKDLDQLIGGELSFRKKGTHAEQKLKTRSLGSGYIFLTGQYHFEHKTNRVTRGRRVVLAGWLS